MSGNGLEALEATVSGAMCPYCGRDKGRNTLEVRVLKTLDDWQPCWPASSRQLIHPNFGERRL